MQKKLTMTLKNFLLIIPILIIPIFTIAQSEVTNQNDLPQDVNVIGNIESGFLGILSHKIQYSNDGDYFDYQEEGGQDVLFPVNRFSLEINKGRNAVILLYQPLRLETQVLLQNDLRVDGLDFPASTGVKLLYNFPFYRVSYLRKLRTKSETFHLEIGASLQLRNTTISFESNDGTLFRTNRNVGPVPILKIRARKDTKNNFFTEFEADGFYAPISYLNGSDNEVIGAILDASIRSGYEFNELGSAFFNLRYLAGGGVGTSDNTNGVGDGYVRNWLNFITVSAGIKYNLSSKAKRN